MQGVNKNYLVLVGILVATGLIAIGLNHFSARPVTSVDLSKIPMKVNGWQGKEIPVDLDVNAILETESVLMREYKKGNDVVWLTIVYYKDSKVALHLPESCLSGQGSKMAEIGEEQIEGVGKGKFFATKLITTSNSGDLLLLYYFKTGNMSTNSYKNMRLNMMLSKIRGYSTGGALVRFSTPMNYTNKASKLSILKNFITDIDPILPKYLI